MIINSLAVYFFSYPSVRRISLTSTTESSEFLCDRTPTYHYAVLSYTQRQGIANLPLRSPVGALYSQERRSHRSSHCKNSNEQVSSSVWWSRRKRLPTGRAGTVAIVVVLLRATFRFCPSVWIHSGALVAGHRYVTVHLVAAWHANLQNTSYSINSYRDEPIQWHKQPTRCNNNNLLVISSSSTCFGL